MRKFDESSSLYESKHHRREEECWYVWSLLKRVITSRGSKGFEDLIQEAKDFGFVPSAVRTAMGLAFVRQ